MSQNNMAEVKNLKTLNRGYELHCEYVNFPVSFVNALRRLILSGIPTVVVQDVQILENTTQIPHEMLKHRVEMLPVNVTPDDESAIRNAKIELRIVRADKETLVTTDDFTVESNRPKLLLRDRDFDNPILFLRLRTGESIHVKASLGVDSKNASQVCVATTSWHVDPELLKENRRKWVEEDKKNPTEFDNFYYQLSYSRNSETGRPNWIDMEIESVGVLPAKEILLRAVKLLEKELQTYMKEALEKITRENEEGSYNIKLEQGGHTLGALLQEVIYSDLNVDFVSYDIPHPLRSTMVIRMHTKKTPESILKTASETIAKYCATVENAI